MQQSLAGERTRYFGKAAGPVRAAVAAYADTGCSCTLGRVHTGLAGAGRDHPEDLARTRSAGSPGARLGLLVALGYMRGELELGV
jgi:hypothetical protein